MPVRSIVDPSPGPPPIAPPAPNHDRRAAPRVAAQRDCKLLHEPSGRFLSARTRDVSATGALLDVITPRDLLPGERVRVAIAWDPRRARVALSALRTGVIVRQTPTPTAGPERRFAIRFDQPDTLPLGVVDAASPMPWAA